MAWALVALGTFVDIPAGMVVRSVVLVNGAAIHEKN